jgi:predicted RNA-binding Zn ribbon-like protein
VTRYDVPKAAPEPLRLVQLFVNSVDKENGREWLPTPEALARWFEERGLPRGVVTEADVVRTHALREALRALLRANNVGGEPGEAAGVVNEAARAGGVSLAVDADGELHIEVTGTGVDGALGEIVAVAFEAMLDGSWTRLKTCRHCNWSFYDESKNRSGSWCSMQLCGNRTKTRAYRRRLAARESA